MSFLLGRAPDASDAYSPREYRDGFRVFVKASTRLGKFVVDQADVDAADAHVLFLHNDEAGRSWMVGWAEKSDLLAAKKGNRFTDPENCKWSTMAHYLPTYTQLRPMSELLDRLSVRSVLPGMLLEQVPPEREIPTPSQDDLDSLLAPAPEGNGDDFYDIIGITEKAQ
jgi:hypothetical protein